jgi:hypothetical protein
MEQVVLYSHSGVYVATSCGQSRLGGRLEALKFGHNPNISTIRIVLTNNKGIRLEGDFCFPQADR